MTRQHFHSRATRGGLLALALLVGPAPQAAPPGTPPAPRDGPPAPPADAVVALNDLSRAAYRRAKEEALARTGPVILVEGDNLVLRYGIQRTEARFTPPAYHVLKSVSHVPLGIYALLAYVEPGPLGAPRLYDLRQYRGAVAAASKAVAAGRLAPAQRERQLRLLQKCQTFLDGAAEGRCHEPERLEALLKDVRPLVDENTAEAARLQLDALHKQVRAWRGEFTDREWDGLLVVVMGSQLPRKDNLAVQYFARLLGEPGEGKRIVYAEAVFDEAKALDLVATRAVDTRVGEAFFADPLRMHRDLLGDAARDYLAELFPKGP
jgi:hypothetical protein